MKRLRSTETLGSTSAINSDKTGTLTLNQMTAVELTIPGRRYTISGGGYATDGTIKHVFGQPEVPLEQFLLPMALCADAVVKDGELIGDPTEGALVVLAEKGGIDVVETRQQYPRVAELPFDSAYKLMATFHRMRDESGRDVVRGLVKGAPDQLLARAASRPDPEDLSIVPVDDAFKQRYMDENERLASQGLRVMATGPQGLRPGRLRPVRGSAPAARRADRARARRDRRPAAADREGGDRDRSRGRNPGAHDHRRPRRHGRGDRQGARHPRQGDHRSRVQGDVRRRARRRHRRRRRDRARRAGGQGAPRRGAEAEGAHRRDDRRRRQRRAGPEERRHRHRDGDHRHRGLEGGRDDDPHRRQLRDDRQGGRARPRSLRQPHQVHPLPDGRAGRLRRHLPRREHLQHRRRRAVRAAADAVRELHDPGAAGDRPRLRPPGRGADAAQAAALRRADPAAAAPDLGRRSRDSCSAGPRSA